MMIHLLMSAALAQSSGWMDLTVCQEDVSACEKVYNTQPRPTRNPALLRFTDPELTNQKWVPLHVVRLFDSSTPELFPEEFGCIASGTIVSPCVGTR